MTRAKKNLSKISTIASYPNVGVYEWNGEEFLPPQLVVFNNGANIDIKKAKGIDNKYYYYMDSVMYYGNGGIKLHPSITIPTTGVTDVSATIEITGLAQSSLQYANLGVFITTGREFDITINGYTGFGANGVSAASLPVLTLGEHILRGVTHHDTNTYDVYIDGVCYGSGISKYQSLTPAEARCQAFLWHSSTNRAKLKSFQYKHTS